LAEWGFHFLPVWVRVWAEDPPVVRRV
jgi:hypothetical protein